MGVAPGFGLARQQLRSLLVGIESSPLNRPQCTPPLAAWAYPQGLRLGWGARSVRLHTAGTVWRVVQH